jgi:hypothetical protein
MSQHFDMDIPSWIKLVTVNIIYGYTLLQFEMDITPWINPIQFILHATYVTVDQDRSIAWIKYLTNIIVGAGVYLGTLCPLPCW